MSHAISALQGSAGKGKGKGAGKEKAAEKAARTLAEAKVLSLATQRTTRFGISTVPSSRTRRTTPTSTSTTRTPTRR